MYKLYLDFDGVIWDTWPHFYKIIKDFDEALFERMMNKKTSSEDNLMIAQIFKNLEWDSIIKNTRPLKDSIKCIEKLKELDLFDMSILTHCNSTNEISNKEKIRDIHIPNTELIAVKKSQCKSTAVDPRGAILVDDYWVNIEAWNNAGGIGIKFTDKEEADCPYYHISSLSQIPDIIKKIEIEHSNKLVKIKK